MNPPARRRAVAYGDPATGLLPVGLPPTLGPTVAELAVSTAGQLNSLAKTVMPDPSRIKRALQLLHRDTPPAVRITSESLRAPDNWTIGSNQLSIVTN
jgi:hypothetical protein